MPDLFPFEPTAYDCRCRENDSPLPKWPARWVFVLLGDFCCEWSLKLKWGTPVINIEAYTAVYRRACILQSYLVSFQATVSRQFIFPPISIQTLVCDLCAVCVLSGNEVIGVDSAEVRVSVQYLHIIDNQQTLFELSHKLEPRAWTHYGACHRGLRGKRHTFATRSPYQQRRPLDCKVPNVLKIPHGNI